MCVCVYMCLLNSRTARSVPWKIGFRMPAVLFITASNTKQQQQQQRQQLKKLLSSLRL